tara:strand:- start:2975 stop:3343 length:369 start_codon:yes stop_codon:yes gene_type:complete
MGFKKLFNYMCLVFLSGLGLFNSTKLEARYTEGSNNELLYQNGIIISSAFMGLFFAAFLLEIFLMRRRSNLSSPVIQNKSKNKSEKKEKPSEKKEKSSVKKEKSSDKTQEIIIIEKPDEKSD